MIQLEQLETVYLSVTMIGWNEAMADCVPVSKYE